MSLDLSSLAPALQPPKPSPKAEPLPTEEKELSDQADKITPNAKSSSPATSQAEDFGTKQAKAKQKKRAELQQVLQDQGPQSTGEEGLKFAINTYKWSYKRFMQNWAVALSKRWIGSADYLRGDYPQGGFVWVKITLSRDGKLEGYEVMDQNVSKDMALMVVYAVMGVRTRPALPSDFPEDKLIAYWRFVYPTYAELKQMIQQARGQQ